MAKPPPTVATAPDMDDFESEGEITSLSKILSVPNPEDPAEDYVPEGYESVDEYLKDLRETYSLDIESDQDNRDAAIEDKRFVAGEQWDPLVLQQRAGLPCLTINTIPQFLAQLVGDWRTNQIAVKVLPANNGDKNIADVRADLIRSIETTSRADRVFNNAFESMIQCGDGAFRVGVKYAAEGVFDQDIVLQPIDDALSVVWDRLSIDPTGRDATHCFVDDIIPRKEFDKRWPDTDSSSLNEREQKNLAIGGWLDDKTVRVTEHWRIIERKKTLIMFKDGSIYTLNESEELNVNDIEAYIKTHGQPVKMREAPVPYAQMHMVTGFKILSGPYEWKLNRLPIIRMSGRTVSVDNRRVRYSLVRFMKDVVRLRNFWRSVDAEQLGYAPKAQWIAPESAVEGREDLFRKAHLSRDPLLVYNDNAEAAPERVEPPQIQTALLNAAQINAQDMKDVTGIQDASLGIPSNETSGRAIMARQREGDVASLTYYDNGNAGVLEAGDVMNQLIPQIYDGTRIIRTIGEDEASKLVNINDPEDPNSPNIATGQYDVAITTGASYTTRRVEAAEAMMNAIQVYPELMQIAGDLVIKAQDWPGAEELSDRLLKTVNPSLLTPQEQAEVGNQPNGQQMMQQAQQTQEQLQQAQQQLQQLQQENQVLKAKEARDQEKILIERYAAETNRMTAYAAILKDKAAVSLQQLESEANHALASQDQTHQQGMDVAGLLQDHALANQSQVADQQAQAADLTAKQYAADQDMLTQERIKRLEVQNDTTSSKP